MYCIIFTSKGLTIQEERIKNLWLAKMVPHPPPTGSFPVRRKLWCTLPPSARGSWRVIDSLWQWHVLDLWLCWSFVNLVTRTFFGNFLLVTKLSRNPKYDRHFMNLYTKDDIIFISFLTEFLNQMTSQIKFSFITEKLYEWNCCPKRSLLINFKSEMTT